MKAFAFVGGMLGCILAFLILRMPLTLPHILIVVMVAFLCAAIVDRLS